jgi:arylsulfatase A-like enzyme
LLLASAVLQVATSCSQEGSDGPWLVERIGALEPAERCPRGSAGNVSRPLWSFPRSAELEIAATPGSFLELEACDGGRIELSARRTGQAIELALELVDSEGEWARYRAPVENLSAGRYRIELKTEREGEVSLPRVYQRRDGQRRDSRKRPNVLWIVLDTVRADYLGCYGHPFPTSPRIDALAREAIVFHRALSQASWTLPAVASMLTGLQPEEHGVLHTDRRLPAAAVSVVERLAREGYTTAAFVSGTFTDSEWGFDQGFDAYDDLGMVVDDAAASDPSARGVAAMREGAHQRVTSPEITERASAWLEQNRDRRFFLWVHYFDPHQDYASHSGVSERFEPLPQSHARLGQADPDPRETARLRALYQGEIAFTDAAVGRLLDRLDELGLSDETLVVLTADHGEEFYERQSLGHGNTLFNEVLRVPLIVRAPGRAPRAVDAPVGTVALAPTFLELCGIGTREDHQGSLAPWLEARTMNQEAPPVLSSLFPSFAPRPGEIGGRVGERVDQGNSTWISDRRLPQGSSLLYEWKSDALQAENLSRRHPESASRLETLYPKRWAQPLPAELLSEIPDEVREALENLGYAEDGG